MQITYDPEKDILQIALNACQAVETAQVTPNFILDYDDDGAVIGIEIRRASQRVDNPMAVAYTVGKANIDKPQPYSAQT
jgi:uncharacterized protein YuzE